VSKSTFISDLNARVLEAEQIIAHQNEKLAALRHLLRIAMGESTSEEVTPKSTEEAHTHSDVDFKGKTSEIVVALVNRAGKNGTRPRDIAAILVKQKLMKTGSNLVHSQLSELKKKGFVRQNSEGLYFGSLKSTARRPVAATPSVSAKIAKTKRKVSAAGRVAIGKAQKARWAAVRKAKG